MTPLGKGRAGVLAALLVVLLGCGAAPPAGAQEPGCVRDQKPMVVIELMFGRNIGGRFGVTEARWRRFVAREITPRFPDGYTVLDGRGHWRDPKGGGAVHERSKVVLLTIPDEEAASDRVSAIVTAYKSKFRQQSVLILRRRACVTF